MKANTADESLVRLVDDYEAACRFEAQAIANRRELREQIIAKAFPGEAQEGTQTLALPDGRELKYTFKFRYALENTDNLESVREAIDKIEGNSTLSDSLIGYSPTLRVAIYRKLAPTIKKLIDSVLTIKPSAPELEIKAPKIAVVDESTGPPA